MTPVPRLRRSDCSGPGIRRRPRGRGFTFVDDDGRRVEDAETIERIAQLRIPPAWRDVWVCPHPNGHLQATGVDAAGRKQYLYHPRWRARRDQQKFDSMLDFARALPAMRRAVLARLRGEELSRERVLAGAVRLLDLGFFRVGGEDYAERNESYGLATIRKDHVSFDGEEVVFDYPAKSGQRRIHAIADPELLALVAALKRRRGGKPELLAFRDGNRWVDVRSDDINAYIKAITGGDFSAKDFRTWNATLLAAVGLASYDVPAQTKTGRKRAINAAVKGVAHFLGNTPAVARASYIDPRVIDRYLSGWTIRGAVERVDLEAGLGDPKVRDRIESAVVDLITDDRASPALEKVA
jgi:DNA topoisomerase-1